MNIDILYFILEMKSVTFIIIGMILTGLGIVSTLIGTIKQSSENDRFQNEISKSTQKNIELSEKLAEQSRLASLQLSKQTEESTNKIIQLTNKNSDLTLRLTEISEDKFRKLTIPTLNLLKVDEVLDLGLNSYFKLTVKNTGNNDCFDGRLIVDRHNSPLAQPGFLVIQKFAKIPKDAAVEFQIPLFRSNILANTPTNDLEKDFSDFLMKYHNDKTSIIVEFHFEYQWNNETLKSSQFSLIKPKNSKAYCRPIEVFEK